LLAYADVAEGANSMPQPALKKPERSSGAHGFSLVGLLMVIVVLGALTATAIVGVSSLTGSSGNIGTGISGSTGTKNTGSTASGSNIGAGISSTAISACAASADAARSASTLYFVNSGGTYPVTWSDMTTSSPPIYKLATNVVINAGNPRELDGRGWKLIVSGGGASEPTFTCSQAALGLAATPGVAPAP